jgi:hypothetical protein
LGNVKGRDPLKDGGPDVSMKLMWVVVWTGLNYFRETETGGRYSSDGEKRNAHKILERSLSRQRR